MIELQDVQADVHCKESVVDEGDEEVNGTRHKSTFPPHSKIPSFDSGFRTFVPSNSNLSGRHDSIIVIGKDSAATDRQQPRPSRLPSSHHDDGIDEDFQNFEESTSFYNGSSRSDSAIDLSNFVFERTSSIGSRAPIQSCRCQCHLPIPKQSSSNPPQFQHKTLQTSISLPIYTNGSYTDPAHSCRKEPWMVFQALPKSSSKLSCTQGVNYIENSPSTTSSQSACHNTRNHNTLIRTDSDYDNRLVECSSTVNLVPDADKSSGFCCQRKGLLLLIVVFAIMSLGLSGVVIYFATHRNATSSDVYTISQSEPVTIFSFINNQTLHCGFPPSSLLSTQTPDTEDQTSSSRFNNALSGDDRRFRRSFIEDPTASAIGYPNPENLPTQINGNLSSGINDFFRMPFDDTLLIRRARVVGGESVSIRKVPWQVVVWKRGHQNLCGASILTKRYVISAAHCFRKYIFGILEKTDYVLYMGMTAQSERHLPPAQTRNISELYYHEKYLSENAHPFDYDIAILKLHADLEFSEYIQPICLPPQDFIYPVGTQCYVSGWGETDFKKNGGVQNIPDQLHQAEVDILSTALCSAWFHSHSAVTDRMFCAGKPNGVQDSCFGDSGGPLSCFDNETGVWTLAGIVSWGVDCGLKHQPGIYTNASTFTDWIWKEIYNEENGVVDETTEFPQGLG